MAKATAPLQSFSAHGAIAKALTFRGANGKNIVSGFSKPGNLAKRAPSFKQTINRQAYEQIAAFWGTFSDSEKSAYVELAKPLQMTGFNLFMRDALKPLPSGLEAYYRAEGNGFDSSGNGHHGTAVSGLAYVQGRYGQAFYTDEGVAYLDIPLTDSLKFETGTIACWVLPDVYTPGESSYVVAWGASNGYRFCLRRAGSDNYWQGSARVDTPSQETIAALAKPPIVYDWTHIAVTYDGETIRIYINGQENGTTDSETGVFSFGDAEFLTIGGLFTTSFQGGYGGKSDEVQLYNRALTPEEIRRIMYPGLLSAA